MYMPAHFNHPEHAVKLMREHPLAQLVSSDDQGFPYVTPLPLHLEVSAEQVVLQGHCAKGNPHWRYLQSRPQALVLFMGPQSFMSTRVYPDLTRVPTWTYLSVQARVEASLVTDEAAKDVMLKPLIADHDPAYTAQWQGLPEDYTQRMLAGVVAFELKVLSLDCKLKLNQHRPEAHVAMHQAYAQGGEQEQALAQWMVDLGMVKAP
jgi:transcriptional regulator